MSERPKVDRASAPIEPSDWVVLASCCFVALGLDLAYAARLHFGFDDHAHVFIAGVEPWVQFLRELAWDAHPPLSYLLLRWLVPLHGAELWPRLLSIVPALGTIVAAFLSARALGMARPVTWLVALIFAVSSTHVNLAIAVRAYSLATFLTLLAFLFLLRLLRDDAPGSARERWAFAGAAVLASWTEYSALLAIFAMSAAAVLHACRDRAFRTAVLRAATRPSRWAAPLVLIVGVAGVVLWMRSTHGVGQVGHVLDCFPAAGQSWAAFALRGATRTLDLFAPLGISAKHAPWLVGPAALGTVLWLAAWDRRHALLAVTIVVLWLTIFALALAGTYPYGGRMRHQFVLFPFFALAVALVVDAALRRIRSRHAVTTLMLVLAVWTAATGLPALRKPPIEEFAVVPFLWAAEIAPAARRSAPDEVLYTGRIDAIAVYSHLRDRRWTAAERGPSDDLFLVERKGTPTIRVVRRDDWWLPSPLDDAAASELAATMRRRGIGRAWVIALVLAPRPVTAERRDDRPVRALLSTHGLSLDERFVFESGETLRVSLRPRPSGEAG
jgi:hypothetical protein